MFASHAEAACRVSGNGQNIFCDTCADAQQNPQSVQLSPNVGPNGGTQGANNAFCRIDQVAPGDLVSLTVDDLNSSGISSFEVDYFRNGANPQSLVPVNVLNQSVAVPGGSDTQNFSHSEAGVDDVDIRVNIADTQPIMGQQPAVSATVTCSCTPQTPQQSLLILRKVTSDGSTGTFTFQTTNVTFNTNSLTTTGGSDETDPATVTPGQTVTIIEDDPSGAGYEAASASCELVGGGAPTNASSYTPGTRELTFMPTAGENVICTFTNRPLNPPDPTLILRKVTTDNSTGTFTFQTQNVTFNTNSLTTTGGSDQTDPATVTAGQVVTITENDPDPAGYQSVSASCELTSGGATTNTAVYDNNTRQLTFVPEDGENVICTFTNEPKVAVQTVDVTLRKVTTDGSTSQFNFASTIAAFNGIALITNGGEDSAGPVAVAGGVAQSITEADNPDYDLVGASCQTAGGGVPANGPGTLSNGTLQFTPDVNDVALVCTFTNFKKNDDPGDEETKRFIHRRVDNLLTHGPDRARLLRRVQEQKPSMKDGPIKLAGTTLMAAPAAMTGSGGGGLHLGAPETGVPWLDAVMGRPEDEPFGMAPLAATGPTSSSSALLSSIAGKLMPLMEGQTSFKFGTSLSEIRTNIAEAEARSQQKKLQDAGLSFEGQPYTNPFLGVREGLDFWIEGHITRYRDDIGGISREGDFRILYVGADYVLADGVLIGGLVQIDDTEEDIDDPTRTGEIDGTGWMVGPYFGARVLDNLFFDARAAWGQSENDIWIDDAGGFRTGSFDTERWLATATLTGVHYHGAWRFSPQIGVAYGHESYDTYVNSLGQTIAGSEANIGRLNGGGEIAYRIERSSGTIVEPMVSLTGIWNFDGDDLVINGVTEQTDETRAKVEGGVMIRTPAGWALRAAGMYDGLGSDDFEAYGGSLWVNIPIYKPD